MAALRIIAGKSISWATMIEAKVAELSSVRYSTDGGEQIRGEIQLLVSALALCHRINVDLAKLGLDERIVRVTEQQGAKVVDMLDRLFAELDLTAGQQKVVNNRVPHLLRELSAA
jgi:hypothetical protein